MESHINYNPDGTSFMFAVFLIVNGTLGSGLLNFPKTFDDAGGIVAACIVQIILLLFVMVSLIALAYASDQCGTNGAENIQVCIISCNQLNMRLKCIIYSKYSNQIQMIYSFCL